MAIVVDPDWWKTLFDEVYLITDARSVCDDVLTCREADVICELLPLDFGHKILDLCGGHGRHTLELYKRGFTNCTLLDYSQKLIDVAETKANENDYSVNFIQCDARSTDLPGGSFDHVIIMGNSLGYIQAPGADSKIIKEAYRILRSGGRLLVDVTDGSVVKNSFNPNSWQVKWIVPGKISLSCVSQQFDYFCLLSENLESYLIGFITALKGWLNRVCENI